MSELHRDYDLILEKIALTYGDSDHQEGNRPTNPVQAEKLLAMLKVLGRSDNLGFP